jgi:hypothetical protein
MAGLMTRLARLVIATAVVLLLAAGSASAWERKESQWWVWYVPTDNWNAAQSATTIDITSPTGVLYVGNGWSSWPAPVDHAWVIDLLRSNSGFDPHPLRNLRVGRGSRQVCQETVCRRRYRWRGYRTDRDEKVTGRLTVDVIRDELTFSYGWATSNRSAPTRQFARENRRLRRIERRIFFKPRTPEFNF